MSNPFQPEMVKMHMPEGGGTSISARGFFLEADKDGCVEVPRDLVAELKSHGLTEHKPAAAPAKK